MKKCSLRYVFLGVVGVISGALHSIAEGPSWEKLSDDFPNFASSVEADLIRSANGGLSIYWKQSVANSKEQIFSRMVSPTGKFTSLSPREVVTPWESLSNVGALLLSDGKERAFFGGILEPLTPNAYNEGTLYSATTDVPQGSTWTLDAGSFSYSGYVYSAGPVGITQANDGTIVSGFAASGVKFQIGLNNSATNQKEVTLSGCCGYDVNVATDRVTGAVVGGYYSNASNAQGVYTVDVYPTFTDTPNFAPESAQNGRQDSLSPDQIVQLASRDGGGVYVAYCEGYPTCSNVRVYKHGGSDSIKVAKAKGAQRVGIAEGTEGRLWVYWIQGNNTKPKLYVSRSNKAATVFEKPQKISLPKNASQVWSTAGEGTSGTLHFVVNAETQGAALWYTRLSPTLSVKCSPKKLTKGNPQTVKCTVTDAKDPVAGAKVKLLGKSKTTTDSGKVSLKITPSVKGKVKVVVSKEGYSKKTLSLKVG